jgi:anti-sigma factor RsiW
MTKNEQEKYVATADDLHGFADGRLPADSAEKVEAYLAAHPEAAAEVADYRRINAVLHEAYDDILDKPVPAAQVAIVRERRPRIAVPIAAAIAGLLAGIVIGLSLQRIGETEMSPLAALVEGSSAAYVVYAPEKRHPVEVAAAEAEHLSKWLSNRIGMSLPIPRLGDLGFELVGGRLLVGGDAPAALLMYENDEGRRIVLYVRNDLPEYEPAPLRYQRRADTGVVTWVEGSAGFGLAGGFSEKELLPAAQLVQAQLSR